MNLGMYMRGGMTRPEEFQAPVDGGMAPVLQGIAYGQQQDQRNQALQAQQFNLQQAQQNADDQQQLNALASQAYTTAPDQRNTLLANMAKLDPREAAAQQQQFARMDAAQQQQAAQAMQNAAGMATAIAQMPDGPQKQQAWNGILQRMQQSGKDTSLYQNVGPDVGAKMMLAQIADSKQLLDMAGMGKPKTPQIADGYQIVTGPDGHASAVPIPIGGASPPAPTSAGFSANVPGAGGKPGVVFDFPPGTPPEVIAAAKASAIANGDVQPGQLPQAGVPRTLADVLHDKAAGGAVTTMTPGQVAAAGLPKGTVAQMGANGAIKVVSKPGADGEAQTFGDTTKTGDAYLQSLDPAMQRQVLALDQGRMQFPSSFALKTPYWQGLLQAVGQYDPSFDAVNYNSRNQTRKNFTAGKEATQVNALNTVAQHLAQLQADANALGNRSFTPYNTLANAIESKTGAPQLTNFERDRLPVVQELERVWRGTGGSEGDIQEWTKNLSSSSSPEQFNDAFAHIANLIHGKLAALRDQYVQGMGNTHDAFQFLTPSTRAIFQSLGGEPVGSDTTAAGEGPHTGAGTSSHIPTAAIQYLRAHPNTAAQFDAQFGPGSAQAAMQ